MYSKAFRTLMVQKMTSPDRPDVESLAAEVGVPRSTLYRWVSDAGNLTQQTDVEFPLSTEPTQRPSRMKRPQDWSAEEKLAAVLEAAALSDEDLGAFLRSRGLYEAQLQQWREQMISGLKKVAGVRLAKLQDQLRANRRESSGVRPSRLQDQLRASMEGQASQASPYCSAEHGGETLSLVILCIEEHPQSNKPNLPQPKRPS